MEARNLERETPITSQIDTIRNYRLLPEKMYKRKLMVLIITDTLMILNFIRMSFGIDELKAGGMYNFFFSIGVYIFLFIASFLAYFIVRSVIPRVLKGTLGASKGIVKKLNPFNAKGKGYDNNNDAITKEWERKWAKEKRILGKSEPFLYFRETKLGMSLREYLVILHVLAYPLFWSGRIDSERFTKFTILHIVITLIIYYLLSKEPARTKLIAIEHLKEAFKYYCSPHGKPLLSKKEKELFEENFKVRVSNRDSHIQGHFSKGVYNNQEFSYWVTLHVDDLKSGHSYSLEYPTNSKHEAWGTIYNTEILTKKGLRLKSF